MIQKSELDVRKSKSMVPSEVSVLCLLLFCFLVVVF